MHGMLRAEQLESGVKQERAEQIENPLESLNQRSKPTPIIAPRNTSAPRTPQNNNRCW